MKIGLVAPVKPSHPYLEDERAPLLDLHYLRISPWLWFRRRRWVSRLFASASLATDTRAYPKSLPLIFRWPPVLAWLHNITPAVIPAMLKFVPL